MGFRIEHVNGDGDTLAEVEWTGRGCRERAEMAAGSGEYWEVVPTPFTLPPRYDWERTEPKPKAMQSTHARLQARVAKRIRRR